MMIPAGFEAIRASGVTSWVRKDVRSWLEPHLVRIATPGEDGSFDALSEPLHADSSNSDNQARGRGGVSLLRAGDENVVVRPFRRGGVPALFNRDLYFGWNPRPFVELELTERLRTQGVPVPEIYAAVVRWIVPGCYRGWLLSRLIEDTTTLWEWAQAVPSPAEKHEVLRLVGAAIRRLHDAGSVHPDLNLGNILVCNGEGLSTRVWLVDFDRSAQTTRIGADIQRLERSVRKLDPRRIYITGDDFAYLRRAYAEAR